jgi:multidrug/hemolysin transport system ATP-binding protein
LIPRSQLAITVEDLTKRFGRVTAVDHLSFRVKLGQLFALLGPNGSGKTTTIRCLTTLERPDSGRLWVMGNRLGSQDDLVRRGIGVVFQESLLDSKLTVRENLNSRGAYYGLSRIQRAGRIEALTSQVELGDFLDQPYGRLSGGQRRRVDIARAIIHQPRALFLDEPTAGLDPVSRDQVWKAINQLRLSQATGVVLTTHYLAETEQADQVLLLGHGRAVAEGTPQALREKFSTSVLTLTPALDQDDAVRRALSPWGGGDQVGGALRVEVPSAATARQLLTDLGPAVTDFEFRHGTMDDVFLALTEEQAAKQAGDGRTASDRKNRPTRNGGPDGRPANDLVLCQTLFDNLSA